MDDRFLTRGKRKDNGKLFKGLLTYISKSSAEITDVITNESFWVDMETVGGCTGLRDKNNKLMFEGDIIRYTANECCDIYFVKWDIAAGRFAAYGLGLGDNYPLGDFVFYNPQKCEVIGNIYDNPELLKSEVAQND